MTIDVLASFPHYADHLAPIWRALPDQLRGRWFAGSRESWRHAAALDLRPEGRLVRSPRPEWRGDAAVLVAGWSDLKIAGRARVAFLEHGSGQTYAEVGDFAKFYSGGTKRERVGLFLCPNETVAAANRAAYPDATVAVVGCPHLAVLDAARRATERTDPPTVAVTFHHDSPTPVPEAGTAWFDYAERMADVVASVPEVRWLGHAHPRMWRKIAPWWEAMGVEVERSWPAVAARADLLAFDNTSAGFEAAALGIPVVVLNARAWRRDVDHGLRFWTYADVGLQVDDPAQLACAIRETLLLDPQRDRRAEVARAVYPVAADVAPMVAAEAVERWLRSWRTTSI